MTALRTILFTILTAMFVAGQSDSAPKVCPAGTSGQDCVNPPHAISTPDPQYSKEARAARVQGLVRLRVKVSVEGNPAQVDVLQSLGHGLDEQAVHAVSQWKFEPAKRDGKPVEMSVNIEVNFHLSPNSTGALTSQDAQKLYADAVAAHSLHDCGGALELLTRVTQTQPNHSGAWNLIGICQIEANDLVAAEAAFKKQIEVTPQSLYAYNNLGRVYLAQRKYDDAVVQFRRQIEISPNDRYAHLGLGNALREKGDYSKAVTELQLAATLRTEDPAPHAALAQCMFKQGNKEAALSEIDKAAALVSNASGWNTLAWILAENKADLNKAEQYVRMSLTMQTASLGKLSIDPLTPGAFEKVYSLESAWDTLGWILFLQGHTRDADKYLLASWQLSRQPTAADHLSQACEAEGKMAEAAHYAALAISSLKVAAQPQESDVEAGRAAQVRLTRLVPRASEAVSIQGNSDTEIHTASSTIPNPQQLTGIAEFAVLQDSRAGSELAKLEKGAPELSVFERTVAHMNASLFPDETSFQLVRWAVLQCESKSACNLHVLSSFEAQKAAIQSTFRAVPKATASSRIFSSETLGISLELPEGWTKSHEVGAGPDGPGPAAWFNKADTAEYFMVRRERLQLTGEDFDRAIQSQIGSSGEMRRRSQSTVDRDGIAGTRSLFDYEQNGVDFEAIVETYSIDDLHYFLIAGAPREQFSDSVPELQKLLQSIKFLPKSLNASK